MKRAKKEELPLYAGGRGGIEFILIPEARTEPSPVPLVPVDFGGYYQGQVKIVTAPHCPDLVGLSVLLMWNVFHFARPTTFIIVPATLSWMRKPCFLDKTGACGCSKTMVEFVACRATNHNGLALMPNMHWKSVPLYLHSR
jgi:hypothetical protein